jgi:hypothetical protein
LKLQEVAEEALVQQELMEKQVRVKLEMGVLYQVILS